MIEEMVIRELNPEREMRYGVYSVQGEMDTGQSFIVLRNGYGMITKFTRLEQYVGYYNYRIYRPIDADVGPKLYYVTRMLNYTLIEHGEEFGIRHVFQITKEMLEQFLSNCSNKWKNL